MTGIPAPFYTRMRKLLGSEFAALAEALNRPPVHGVRFNTLKVDREQIDRLEFPNLKPVPWCPAGFTFSTVAGDKRLGRHPYHAAGIYYLQDPSAMAVAEAAAPQPGERVLDLAAAPGGKATHLASLMNNQGLLVANEINPRRVWDLAENLERWGATNVTITNDSPEKLAAKLPGFFDVVVVDAPCSGEGMFRKSAAARAEWMPALVTGCALRQGRILSDAAELVRPGGRLVYSTCTFSPEENEGVIGRFLEQHAQFKITPSSLHEYFAPGNPTWASLPPDHPTRHTMRLWPHRLQGEGHFIAVLQKKEGPPPAVLNAFDHHFPDKETVHRAAEWAAPTLNTLPWERQNLHLYKDQLYQLPQALPDLTGVRLIRPGWWLGTLKKKRFEPSHSLALTLKREMAKNPVDLRPDDPQTAAYLRGELLESAGPDGWVLVTVNRFGLGWGKRVNGRVKNHYPKGLRRTS